LNIASEITMSKKLLTVFGATGRQGGSVLSVILNSPELNAKYALRGVTRDPSKPGSQALAARGVEMVKGDLSDAASLQATLQGSYAVFGVTNYWENFNREAEEKQGRAIADAAFAAGVKHLVWSSLPHVEKLTKGKLDKVDHFDGKANVEAYIEANRAKTGTTASYFLPAVFMEQIENSINPGPDGQLAMSLHIDPKKSQFPILAAAADTGKYVVGILEAGPEKTNGLRVNAVGDWLTPESIVQTINEVAGTKIQCNQIPRDVFKSFMPPHAGEELTQNFEFIQDYSYYGLGAEKQQADNDRWLLQGSKKTSWREYVAKNGPWGKA
jgi:uncharacterized protein YbjT (DUF2867 family)